MNCPRPSIIRSSLDYLVHLRRLGVSYVPRPAGETLASTPQRSASGGQSAAPPQPPRQAERAPQAVIAARTAPPPPQPTVAAGSGQIIPQQVKWVEIRGAADESLADIAAEAAACSACPLGRLRRQAVPGEGPANARIMIIGEGPGSEEDQSGRPFVGPAGQLLMKILGAIGWQREEVFITNTVKCRPPGNRQPEPDEINACRHFWARQATVLRPQILLILGGVAAQTVLETRRTISSLRGNFYYINGIYLMPTFHPSAILHNESYKRPVWEDMKLLRDLYARLQAESAG